MMHYYTSITSNYLPKARVLASSIKRHDAYGRFHLLLADRPPAGFDLEAEPFDSVIGLEELPIENVRGWAFKHSLVEMCTAVKGIGALEIVRRHRPDKLFYFDPDIVVFGALDELGRLLESHSVLLTPHLTDPERSRAAILDNEISTLKHGIYNLGFLGVACEGEGEGARMLRWWSQRLLEFCRDDIPGGLFTDQRWADLMPAMFDHVHVLREPQYNVATWNLSNRRVTGKAPHALTVNGLPLSFYHFSGFDSGAQATMLGIYGSDSPVLLDLRRWYVEQCEAQGQSRLGKLECVYSSFDNGETVTRMQRVLYREREDLQRAFPNPYDTHDAGRSYYHWFERNAQAEIDSGRLPSAASNDRLAAAERELALIRRSRSWKLARFITRLANVVR